jgi:hypothetical protein
MKYALAYSDGRTLEVHAPSEADARTHAAVVEAQRVERARAAGVEIVAATVTAADKLKD